MSRLRQRVAERLVQSQSTAAILTTFNEVNMQAVIDLRNRYKDKFDPVWAPRYIAAARKWAIPILLADVGLISSGGVAGLTRRGRRHEDRAELRPAA